MPANKDTYSTKDTGEFQDSIAFRTTRRGSDLSKTITGKFPRIDGRILEERERLGRLNHERVSLLHLLDELQRLEEGQTTLVTLWVSDLDGIIRTVKQHVWERPMQCSSLSLEVQREQGGLRIIWLDYNAVEHEQGRRWFKAREGTVIEPPRDPSEYVFAGNDKEVIRHNNKRLQDLFEVNDIRKLIEGEHLPMVTWVELETGLIDNFSLDMRMIQPRDGYGFVIAEVTREDRYNLGVRFVDTASIQGIPRKVFDWYAESGMVHPVIDPSRNPEVTIPAGIEARDPYQDDMDTVRPPTRAATPRTMGELECGAGTRVGAAELADEMAAVASGVPAPLVAASAFDAGISTIMGVSTSVLGPASQVTLTGLPRPIGR